MKLRPVYNVPSIANSKDSAQSFHLIVSNAKDTPQKQSRGTHVPCLEKPVDCTAITLSLSYYCTIKPLNYTLIPIKPHQMVVAPNENHHHLAQVLPAWRIARTESQTPDLIVNAESVGFLCDS